MKKNFHRYETEVSQFAPTIPETPSTLNSSLKPSALESPKNPVPATNFLAMPDVPEGAGSPSQKPFYFSVFFYVDFHERFMNNS